MSETKKIRLAFYGDDFTGSTDALEFISRAGAKTVLFTEPPSTEQLHAFPQLDAYGVAGKTRSLAPAEMQSVLLQAFEKIKATGPNQVHYKVCSTFDSSPVTGSIGKAIDCGAAIFNNPLIPVLGGTPALGRYCIYGNLFARMGIGSKGKIYRLDRHPSMSKHPVTPALESDLRLHLGKQTQKPIGLIDVLHLDQSITEWKLAVEENESVVLIDCLYEEQLSKIGEWMNGLQENDRPVFSVGSSAVEMALGAFWNKTGLLHPKTEWDKPGNALPLLVISGSCSPVTAGQIAYAKANGFEEVELNAVAICNDEVAATAFSEKVNALLSQQKHVIVHTGPKQATNLPSEKIGTVLGTIAKQAVLNTSLKRVVIAGGDTSSYAARTIGIDAVEMIAPLVSGAPLCKAYSTNEKINGLKVNFKGGQVGDEKYFLTAAAGG